MKYNKLDFKQDAYAIQWKIENIKSQENQWQKNREKLIEKERKKEKEYDWQSSGGRLHESSIIQIKQINKNCKSKENWRTKLMLKI